jgi:uncharacterized protein YecE (DUF72 family)
VADARGSGSARVKVCRREETGRTRCVTVFVGTSGWQYRHWRGVFYPQDLRQAEWLDYYTARFQTVEVNNTFYRLPERATFVKWTERTPADFVIAAKFSRYLTHYKRLRDPQEPVRRFCSRAAGLGSKLGPILLQLPPDFPVDSGRLRETLAEFPPGTRVAVEFRHPSWFIDEVRSVLAAHHAALCWADRAEQLRTPTWRTTSWTFVRFHEGLAEPRPCYTPATLRSRARLLADEPEQDAYVFFNNDACGCAPRDAQTFVEICGHLGLQVGGSSGSSARTRLPTSFA